MLNPAVQDSVTPMYVLGRPMIFVTGSAFYGEKEIDQVLDYCHEGWADNGGDAEYETDLSE